MAGVCRPGHAAAAVSAPVIVPWPQDAPPFASHRTGSLSGVWVGQIVGALGFEPERYSVEGITDHEWRFTADGEPCAIWDMHGSGRRGMWSTFGPPEVFANLFGFQFINPRRTAP